MSVTATHITLADPDNPMGSPAYDGPANRAHERLEPGVYFAADQYGQEVMLTVTEHSTDVLWKPGERPTA